ncbi:MAG: PQQ-binding-like beta-propeller repeat protein [Planctomycetes bacterium]|nr:PQQ-binding-like beta-propeller repeat protein [Planctomycetota bacterium]
MSRLQMQVVPGIVGVLVLTAGTALSQESPKPDNPPSESEFKLYDQGGIVVDGVAYFTGTDSPGKDHVAAFDVHTLRRLKTYAFAETYDSSPMLFQKKDGAWLIIAHEHKKARTVALNRDTGQVEWISDANQPGTIFFGFSYYDLADGTKLILSPCSNGLHAMDAETGKDVWWVKAGPTGGVTPCVDQEKGWIFYQSSGKVMKISATDGRVLKSVNVSGPSRCSSWNTVLVNDSHGYFVATRWYGKPEWDSAIRVYDKDLDLVWEKTGLPIGKKSTLTYAEGKLVFGGGNCWAKRPEGDPIDYGYLGDEWKYVAAYEIGTGDIAWKCDLVDHDFTSIMNVPFFKGFFYAETQNGPFASKILRIAAGSGELQETLDYGRPITSCGQCIMGHGLILSGDLKEHRLVITRVAEGSKADWPGPFGDPQTNQMALPDDGNARLVPMKELGRAKPDRPKK